MTAPQPAADLRRRWTESMMNTYGVPPLVLARGQGTRVWDDAGREYLDLFAGIAVNSLGHAHPAVREAVARQLATLGQVSNLFVTEPGVLLAERLLELAGATGPGRVFFANSGTEAVEAALKLVRLHGRAQPEPRTEVVAAHAGFHGRTLGALAVTGNAAKRLPFEPLPGPVRFVPFGDSAALRAAVTPLTAGVILEPVQGEAGVVMAPPGYLADARRACDEVGALLVLDEVQGGIGRCGTWLSSQHPYFEPVSADIVTLAKGLGGGLPIGACVALTEGAAAVFTPGTHGSTFGGNPVCAAAALAVLDTIEGEGLLGAATELGDGFAAGLPAHPLLGSVDGLGLWRGLALTAPVAAAVEQEARDRGFLVNAAVPDRVRLAPALIVSRAELDRFAEALPAILDAAARVAR